jgi:hypothetical protein
MANHPNRSRTARQIAYVNKTMPNGDIVKITEAEACALRDGALMRPGKVSIQVKMDEIIITDSNGQTVLSAVYEGIGHGRRFPD